jgi:hypothetical protein
MVRKFVLNLAVLATAFGFSGAANAITIKGVCMITASVHGGKKFATLKCSKASEPGDYMIRSTVWDAQDHAGYARMTRFAGRKFSCDLTLTGTTRGIGVETTHYKLEKCK